MLYMIGDKLKWMGRNFLFSVSDVNDDRFVLFFVVVF